MSTPFATPSQLVLIPDERGEPVFQQVVLAALPPNSELYGDTPDAAMVETVERYGILQPVILIERSRGYSVADGRNRVKAARAARLAAVPSMVYPQGWAYEDVLTLIANSQRRPNPIADLRAIESLVRLGAAEQDMCEATGLTATELRARMRLQGLVEPMRRAVEGGRIKVAVAGQAAKLSAPLQRQLCETLDKRGVLTGADVKAVTRAGRQDAFSALPPELSDTPGLGMWGDEDLESPKFPEQPAYWVPRVLEHIRRAISLLPDGDPSKEWLLRTPVYVQSLGGESSGADTEASVSNEETPHHVVGSFDPDTQDAPAAEPPRGVRRNGHNGHGHGEVLP